MENGEAAPHIWVRRILHYLTELIDMLRTLASYSFCSNGQIFSAETRDFFFLPQFPSYHHHLSPSPS